MVSITLLFLLAFQPGEAASDMEAQIATIFTDVGTTDHRLRKTKNFLIGYDTSDDYLRSLILRIEGTHDAVTKFCTQHGFDPPPRERLGILFFDRADSFSGYAGRMRMPTRGIAGFYHQHNNLAAFVNAWELPSIREITEQLNVLEGRMADMRSSDPPTDKDVMKSLQDLLFATARERDALVEQINQFVIQHEVAHQVLYNAGVHTRGAAAPQWLVEGLACQFEMPSPDLSGKLQKINQMRLADLREAMGVPPGPWRKLQVDARKLLAEERLIPLKQLVAGEEVFDSGDRLALAYAQSWSLVLFLHRTQPDAFREYLHNIAKREPGTQPDPQRDAAEFHAAFGNIDEAFTQAWADFVLSLRF